MKSFNFCNGRMKAVVNFNLKRVLFILIKKKQRKEGGKVFI